MAFQESIQAKGSNSYYVAHANPASASQLNTGEVEAVLRDLEALNGKAKASYCRTVLQRNILSLKKQLEHNEASKQAVHSSPIPQRPPAEPLAESDSGEEAPDSDDSGDVSDPEEELAKESRLEAKVEALKGSHGAADDRTLKKVFQLANNLIAQYKLNKVEALLEEFMSVCNERGGDWYIKAIQALGFCRWKQYKLHDALALFLEQESIIGKSAALCENIGHTYSSLGDLDKAAEYFECGLELLKRGSFGNCAGLYYGLGLIKERQGKGGEAIPILGQALDMYKEEHSKNGAYVDSSIVAKVHMSIAKIHESGAASGADKKEKLAEAAKNMQEALCLFRKTVGAEHPLTANALGCLGKVRVQQGLPAQAAPLIREALQLEVNKDAFHLDTVFELLGVVKDLHTGAGQSATGEPSLALLHAAYKPYVPAIETVIIRGQPFLQTPGKRGDVGALFKAAGEVLLLAAEGAKAEPIIKEALELFKEVKATGFNSSTLITACEQMLLYISGQP